jgi:hypothetical protein
VHPEPVPPVLDREHFTTGDVERGCLCVGPDPGSGLGPTHRMTVEAQERHDPVLTAGGIGRADLGGLLDA